MVSPIYNWVTRCRMHFHDQNNQIVSQNVFWMVKLNIYEISLPNTMIKVAPGSCLKYFIGNLKKYASTKLLFQKKWRLILQIKKVNSN